MDIIEIIKAVLIGTVQGITEWLPVSSTGHMILFDEIIKLNVSEKFMEFFLVVIQFGSILAVILLFFNKLNPFSNAKTSKQKKETFSIWFKVLVASVPAGIIGILFDDKIDSLFYNYKTVALTLIIYGFLFIIVENKNKNQKPKITSFNLLTYKHAFYIGIFQILALIPGTSRSGATILGAVLLSSSRYIAAEFSFFLAIPVMLGASLLKLLKFGFNFNLIEISVLIFGMLTAFIVSIFAIKYLMNFIKKHDFKVFGYYRIILGIIVILFFSFSF